MQNTDSGGFSVCFPQKTFSFSEENHPKGYRRMYFATPSSIFCLKTVNYLFGAVLTDHFYDLDDDRRYGC